MKKNYLFMLMALVLFFGGCVKNERFTPRGNNNWPPPPSPASLLISPGSIYLGSALFMSDMAEPHAAGWQTVRNYGVGLHVHPVGWRDELTGQFGTLADEIGPKISANLNNKTFTYEYDMVDPRAGRNNVLEVQKIQSYGLTCTRVLCNIDVAELDTNPNLPAALRDSVVIPFNNIGIAVDILFSPVSPPALEMVDGKTRMERLIENDRWVHLLFDQANAQGVSLDIPTTLYAGHRDDIILPILQQARASGHEVLWLANFDGVASNISTLGSLINDLTTQGLEPQRWVFENFNPNSHFTPVLEKNFDGSPSEHAAGAALSVCRQTSVPEPDDLLYPDETKFYNIMGVQSDKCIAISNQSTAEGAPAWIWSYMGELNQHYIFVPTADDGYYKIISLNSNRCLGIDTSVPGIDANLVQLTDNDGDYLKWKLVNVDFGHCKIVNKGSGLCIDVQGYATNNGGNIWTNIYSGEENQKWYYTIRGNYP